MCTTAEPGTVQLSQGCFDQLRPSDFVCELKGHTVLRSTGRMRTYLLKQYNGHRPKRTSLKGLNSLPGLGQQADRERGGLQTSASAASVASMISESQESTHSGEGNAGALSNLERLVPLPPRVPTPPAGNTTTILQQLQHQQQPAPSSGSSSESSGTANSNNPGLAVVGSTSFGGVITVRVQAAPASRLVASPTHGPEESTNGFPPFAAPGSVATNSAQTAFVSPASPVSSVAGLQDLGALSQQAALFSLTLNETPRRNNGKPSPRADNNNNAASDPNSPDSPAAALEDSDEEQEDEVTTAIFFFPSHSLLPFP